MIRFFVFIITLFYSSFLYSKNITIFSTSSDWEKLTGYRFKEYFVDTNNISKNDKYIYMDSFPCYGLINEVSISVNRQIKILCLFVPKNLTFVKEKTKKIYMCKNNKENSVYVDFTTCTEIQKNE